jgi:hypothetical protein
MSDIASQLREDFRALLLPENWKVGADQVVGNECRGLAIGKFGHRSFLSVLMAWRRHHRSPAEAIKPVGRNPEAQLPPGMSTVPLCVRGNANLFWIILLLV